MNSPNFDDDYVRRTKDELEKINVEIQKLETRRKILRDLLSTYKDSNTNQQLTLLNTDSDSEKYDEENGATIRERILGVVKTLIEANGKSARLSEIIDYIEKNNVDMGKSAKPRNLISSILSTEVKRKNGVLKKVRRGMYNFK